MGMGMADSKEEGLRNTLIDNLPAQIFWKNLNLEYLGCNLAFLNSLGLTSKDEVIGKSDFDLPVAKDASLAYRNDDMQIIKSLKPKLNIEEQQVLSDGTIRYLSTNKVPLINEEGHIYGVLGIYIDITKRIEAELALAKTMEDLQRANRAKDVFLQNMSHDIRTPLSGIIGMSQILEHEVVNLIEKEHAHMVNVSGERLLSLLNSILDIVKSDHEDTVSLQPFSIWELLQDIKDLELPTAKMKHLSLIVEIDPDMPKTLISDSTKIHRIVLNLLGNALKFTQQGGITLCARTHKLNKKLVMELKIKDTGLGIAEEFKDKIFDRFFKITPSYKEQTKGYGVGLHIVQQYIKQLNGEIQMMSTLGIGTEFVINIPVELDKASHISSNSISSQANDATSEILNHNSPQILLVEDNQIALKMVELIVSGAQCRPLSAVNGEDALIMYQNNHCDMVITDIGLPGISGNQLAQAIRLHEKKINKKPTPIIGLTAHAVDTVEHDSIAAGMNLVLTKPIQTHVLNEILSRFVTMQNEQLSQCPLFDLEEGLKYLGTEQALNNVLIMLSTKALPVDIEEMNKAYDKKDWIQIKKTAHKMKSSSMYCGTVRLTQACTLLELNCNCIEQEQNYQQLTEVLAETQAVLKLRLDALKSE